MADDFITKVYQYVEDHIEQELDNKRLADAMGYSVFHFIRKFKEKTHCTPMTYVCHQKLVHCASELACGARIIDTAFKYGFSDQAVFSKAFKREFGLSPSFIRNIRIGVDIMKRRPQPNNNFLTQRDAFVPKEVLYQQLIDMLNTYSISWNPEIFEQVYHAACIIHQGKTRYSGEDFLIHPLNVAMLLIEMEAEAHVVMAGLFSGCEPGCDLMTIKDQLPDDVYSLVLEIQHPLDTSSILDELSNNAILIRLAQRLHNMRTLEYLPPERQKEKILETIEVYLPIARLIGARQLADELTELSIYYGGKNE